MAPFGRGKENLLLNGYVSALCEAMSLLAEHPRSVFIGQAVAVSGTSMSQTFLHLPPHKLVELPVMEETQMGMSLGIALAGGLPISVYPRWDFLLLATCQLVLHLDKIPLYSNGGYKPRVIVRTAIPTPIPLDPGPQHNGDHTAAFRLMLKTVRIVELHHAGVIVPAYKMAMEHEGSTILVERTEHYG